MQQGQTVANIEVMNMPIRLQTKRAGLVPRVKVEVGDRAVTDDVLIEFA